MWFASLARQIRRIVPSAARIENEDERDADAAVGGCRRNEVGRGAVAERECSDDRMTIKMSI